ncbi:MAG: hypothetical protein ACOCV2_14230 [Persicimonas sp.]
MSDTHRDEPHTDGADGQKGSPLGTTTIAVAAFILALPAAVPLLVVVEPALVPFVSDVDTSDAGMVGFLAGMSLILLILNWGFLYVIHRWLTVQGRE